MKRRDSVRRDFLSRFAKRQGLGLRKEVGHQEIVVWPKWVKRLAESDEVAWDQFGPLVDELVECMLAVSSRLAPDNRPGLIIYPPAFQNVFKHLIATLPARKKPFDFSFIDKSCSAPRLHRDC